jgi:hypothetical protein
MKSSSCTGNEQGLGETKERMEEEVFDLMTLRFWAGRREAHLDSSKLIACSPCDRLLSNAAASLSSCRHALPQTVLVLTP